MDKSKKKKFAKPDMFETMKRLNKELEKVAWLHLYHPTERLEWMGLPKEKWSLHLLNDPRYPIPRKLLAYENESEKWDEVFQEEIVDRLHEMIVAAFSNRAYPYQEIILSPGEWEYSPMYQKLTGIVIFKLSQRCNFGEVAPRGTIRVNLFLPRVSASYTPTFHPMQMANAISGLKKRYYEIFSDDSNSIQIEEKLTAPYGEKGFSETSRPFHVDDDDLSAGRIHYVQKDENNVYSYEIRMNNEKDDRSQKIRQYLTKILPSHSVLKDLNLEAYAYNNPVASLSIDEKLYLLPDLVRKYITNFRQPKYSDIALAIIGQLWAERLQDYLNSEGDETAEIDIKWDRLSMIPYSQRIDAISDSQSNTLIMTAFINWDENLFRISITYTIGTDPHLIRIVIDNDDWNYVSVPELDLVRLKNLFIESLIETSSGRYIGTSLVSDDQLFRYIEQTLYEKWSNFFKPVVNPVIVKIVIDDGEDESPSKLVMIHRGEYLISKPDQVWGLSLTIHKKSGIIDLTEIADVELEKECNG